MSKPDAVYLGDGAYATFDGWYSVAVTANHHDPARASGVVYLDNPGMQALVREARARGYRFGADPVDPVAEQ